MSNENKQHDSADMLIEPRLPQELERIIFEMAGHADRKRTLLKLMLVAHRVKSWMQSVLYEIVILRGGYSWQEKLSCLHHQIRYPSDTQALHIKCLMLCGDMRFTSQTRPEDILSKCYNILDLSISTSYVDAQTLSHLMSMIYSPLRTVSTGLQRLTVSLSALFLGGQVDFCHEALKDITHLDVLNHPIEFGWVDENNFACLKRLKCLAFGNFHSDYAFPHEILARSLEECEVLELLIIHGNDPDDFEDEVAQLQRARTVVDVSGMVRELPEDRVVVHVEPSKWTMDWFGGAEGGEDFWIDGEKAVKRRRHRREVKTGKWDPWSDWGLDIHLGLWFGLVNA